MPTESSAAAAHNVPSRVRTLSKNLGTHFPPTHDLHKAGLPAGFVALIAPMDNDFPGESTVVVNPSNVQVLTRHPRGGGWTAAATIGEWTRFIELETLILTARVHLGLQWFIRPLGIAREMVGNSGFIGQSWSFAPMKLPEGGWKVDAWFEGEVTPKEWQHRLGGLMGNKGSNGRNLGRLLVERKGVIRFDGPSIEETPFLANEFQNRVLSENRRVQELLEIGYRERMWQLWSKLAREFELGLDQDLTPEFEFAVRLPGSACRVVVTPGYTRQEVVDANGVWWCINYERSWLTGIVEICRKFLLQENLQAQDRIVPPVDGRRQFALNV